MLLLIELILAASVLTATVTRGELLVPVRARLPEPWRRWSGCPLCVSCWLAGGLALLTGITVLDWLAVWGGGALAGTWLVGRMDGDFVAIP